MLRPVLQTLHGLSSELSQRYEVQAIVYLILQTREAQLLVRVSLVPQSQGQGPATQIGPSPVLTTSH